MKVQQTSGISRSRENKQTKAKISDKYYRCLVMQIRSFVRSVCFLKRNANTHFRLARRRRRIWQRNGVNFTNILQAAFSFENVFRSFYVLTVWVCNFFLKRNWRISCLVNSWWNWLKETELVLGKKSEGDLKDFASSTKK